MVYLAALLKGLFSNLTVFLGAYVSRKVAWTTSFVVAMGALTAAFFAAINAVIVGLSFSFPESGSAIETMIWVATPSQVTGGISIAIAFEISLGLYRWNAATVKRAFMGVM